MVWRKFGTVWPGADSLYAFTMLRDAARIFRERHAMTRQVDRQDE